MVSDYGISMKRFFSKKTHTHTQSDKLKYNPKRTLQKKHIICDPGKVEFLCRCPWCWKVNSAMAIRSRAVLFLFSVSFVSLYWQTRSLHNGMGSSTFISRTCDRSTDAQYQSQEGTNPQKNGPHLKRATLLLCSQFNFAPPSCFCLGAFLVFTYALSQPSGSARQPPGNGVAEWLLPFLHSEHRRSFIASDP